MSHRPEGVTVQDNHIEEHRLYLLYRLRKRVCDVRLAAEALQQNLGYTSLCHVC